MLKQKRLVISHQGVQTWRHHMARGKPSSGIQADQIVNVRSDKFNTYTKTVFKLGLLGALLFLSACSGLLFYPDKHIYRTPDQAQVRYENIFLDTPDGERLHGWLLHASMPLRGVVYFLHGNAENISTHCGNVIWLPQQGYDVFCLDYRGFGLSSGKPDMAGALSDVGTGYEWLKTHYSDANTPLFVLGQSIGAVLTINFVGRIPLNDVKPTAVIADAPFSELRDIAREKLAAGWLTWAFQYPFSYMLPANYDPVDYVRNISPIPLLIIHSTSDQVIPYHHGERVFQHAGDPKYFLSTDTPHTATFSIPEYRQVLLNFLANPEKSPL
ncbi:alpha/beta hydrolase [Hahella sp. NBU794]|uniref:alpha/beta hydrolase n=1 Tax=Hahella sp. NBU794 TaxID=3422590 RepID=UPI003D6F9FD5